MNYETVLDGILVLVLIVLCVLVSRGKSERYGGYTDPIKFRVGFIRTSGFRRKHPEDELYGDDGRINRHWKP